MSGDRRRVTLTFTMQVSYETMLEGYPDTDPKAMAELDVENDPATALAGEWKVLDATVSEAEGRS